MIPAFRIDPDFHGPTLTELTPILADLGLDDPPMAVRWSGTTQDFLALERAKLIKLVLVVPDQEVLERTLWRLDGSLEISPEQADTTLKNLFSTTQQASWRKQVAELGQVRSTMLLCRVLADALKDGKKVRPSSVAIARDCLLERLNPADADVLVRLRTQTR
jgi:hypothetical protein